MHIPAPFEWSYYAVLLVTVVGAPAHYWWNYARHFRYASFWPISVVRGGVHALLLALGAIFGALAAQVIAPLPPGTPFGSGSGFLLIFLTGLFGVNVAGMPGTNMPDAFAILCRNLVENALRHGGQTTPVDVTLTASGQFTVANDGPVVPGETLDRLTARFERASATSDGSGLGLAIVAAIAERISSRLVLQSPRPGRTTGFQVSLRLPIDDSE